MNPSRPLLVLLLLLFLGGSSDVGRAAPRRASSPDPRDFASFADGFFAGQRSSWKVPGLVFAAVADGKVLYLKGYGEADREAGRPVDPESTVFRVASVSKVLTALTTLRLAEEGKLALSDDVNTRLRRFKIPPTFPEPVRLIHLLTHTGGFDDRWIGSTAPDGVAELDFAKALPGLLPARVFPPGSVYSYSNFGMALAGAVVESVSRRAFSSTVRDRILIPLGMRRSGFVLDQETEGHLATGYYTDGPEPYPVEYEYFYDAPAISFHTTGGDMARLLLALTGRGMLEGRRVLPERCVTELLRRHFGNHPKLDGSALGFYERTVNGYRAVEHAGDVDGFSSLLFLVPEKGFGFFYAANTDDADLRDDLVRVLMDRYFPRSGQPPSLPAPPGRIPLWERGLEGAYRHNRYARSTVEKAYMMFEDPLEVRALEDGRMEVSLPPDWNRAPSRWIPLEPGLFLEEGKERYAAFRMDEHGQGTHLFLRDAYEAYERIAPWETPRWQRRFLGGFAAAGLAALGAGLARLATRRRQRWYEDLRGLDPVTWFLLALFWALGGGFLGGLWWTDREMGTLLGYGLPLWAKGLFLLPFVALVPLAGALIRGIRNLRRPGLIWERGLFLLDLAAAAGFSLFLNLWNLLGFRF